MEKFKSKVVSINEKGINNDKLQGTAQAKILNDYINTCEAELKTEFNNDDRQQLRDKPNSFLTGWIKELYQFPNASDDFNNEALGIDIKTLINQSQAKEWLKYDMILTDEGIFEYDNSNVIEKYTTYTNNQFQNDCVDIANELINIIDIGIEKGVLSHYQSIDMAKGFRVLELDISRTDDKLHNIAMRQDLNRMEKLSIPFNLLKK